MPVIRIGDRNIQFPDTMSGEEINAAAAQIYRDQQPRGPQAGASRRGGAPMSRNAAPNLSGEDAFTRGAAGFARPIVETVYGAKQLAGKALEGMGVDTSRSWLPQSTLTPEQNKIIDTVRQPLGFAGGAGRVAGEIATLAAPTGAVIGGASKLPVASKALKSLSAILAESGVVGGAEALKSPTDERSRGTAAQEGATGAAIGGVLGATAGPAVRGVGRLLRRPMTDEVAGMVARDIPLTSGQSGNRVGKFVEERVAPLLPFASGAVKRRRAEGVEAWNLDLLNRSNPLPDQPITEAGNAGVAQVQKRFSDAYAKLWNTPVQGGRWDQGAALGNAERLPEEAAKRVKARLTAQHADLNAGLDDKGVSPVALERVDDQLRLYAQQARRAGYPDEAEAYDLARESFHESLPAEMLGELRRLDKAYRQWVPVETAAGYKGAATQGGIISPTHLQAAARASDKTVRKRKYATGNAPQQREATNAAKVFGAELPEPGPGTGEKIAAMAYLINPLAAAADAGLSFAYRSKRKVGESTADYARRLRREFREGREVSDAAKGGAGVASISDILGEE